MWALAVQLYGVRSARNWGHGDFTDLLRAGRPCRRSRRRRRRAQSAACLVRRSAGGAEPVLPEQPSVSQSALHRPRRGAGISRAARGRPGGERSSGFETPAWSIIAAVADGEDAGAANLRYGNFRQAGSSRAARRLRSVSARARVLAGTVRVLRAAAPQVRWSVVGLAAAMAKRGRRGTRHACDGPRRRTSASSSSCSGWRMSSSIAVARERASAVCRSGFISTSPWAFAATASTPGATRMPILPGMAIGAPPDALNRSGQDWGLAAFNPVALEDRQFEPFRRMLQASMHYAGAIRLDHVLGLKRLFLVPDGMHGRARRLHSLSVRGAAGGDGAVERRGELHRHRGGPRHRAGAFPRDARRLGPMVVPGHAVRAPARRGFCSPGRLSGECAGHVRDPRSADLCGLAGEATTSRSSRRSASIPARPATSGKPPSMRWAQALARTRIGSDQLCVGGPISGRCAIAAAGRIDRGPLGRDGAGQSAGNDRRASELAPSSSGGPGGLEKRGRRHRGSRDHAVGWTELTGRLIDDCQFTFWALRTKAASSALKRAASSKNGEWPMPW